MKKKNERRISVKLMVYAALLLALSVTAVLWGQETVITVSSTARDLPIYCVQRDHNVVSLTFDAAWGNEDTQQLIDILGKYNVRATFFVVGEWVDKYPESVKALHDAGHEIMNHSDTHPHMTALTEAKMIAEVESCDDKIEAITGVRPTLFRPPYGDYNNAVVGAMRDSGHFTIQWDVDSLDWKEPGADAIVERVLERVNPGSIVLFHNAAPDTPAALPRIIEGLLARNYSFVPVSELIFTQDFTIDHTGKQIANG